MGTWHSQPTGNNVGESETMPLNDTLRDELDRRLAEA